MSDTFSLRIQDGSLTEPAILTETRASHVPQLAGRTESGLG
jgi:hypothetical protein